MKYDFHHIVIGGGSAGLTAASGLAGLGAKVALIEKHRMGGDCLNYGCVPSKSFLKSAHIAKLLREAKQHGLEVDFKGADIRLIMERVRSVIREIASNDSQERFESMGVKVFRGNAEILDRHTVEIDKHKKIRGRDILIATGSNPRIPDLKGLNEIDYLTNKSIFELKSLPNHLIVLGGGPIGLEIGQGFSHLGSHVSIIDHNDRLFPKDDAEVWNSMNRVFQEEGIDLVLGASPLEVQKDNEYLKIIVEQNGSKTEIIGDALLVSAGRVPDTEGLNLSRAGIKTDEKGYIITNRRMQTNLKNVYAAGDVTGPYQFTHMASYQAVKVVYNSLLKIPQKTNYSYVPWTTYTMPEVAHVGYTEEWASKLKLFRDKVVVPLSDNDRAKTDGEKAGFLKLIIGKKNRLIGATIVSGKAGEMIPLATIAINKKMKATVFASLILSYPTQSEIFAKASLELMKKSLRPWMKNLIKIIFLRKL